MALITVEGVNVLDNPSKFSNPFQFEITFSCNPPGIPGELEWKLIYVGSADNEKLDQELDSVLVGPIAVGRNKFVFQAPPPDPTSIPEKDLLEVTVILLTCSYLDQEFIRVGYYVNNDYGPNVQLMNEFNTMKEEGQEPRVALSELHRHILADKPRVTRFQIHWTEDELKAAKQQQAMQQEIPCTDSAPSAYQGEYQDNAEMDDEDMEEEDLDDDSEEEEGDDDEDFEDDDKENVMDSYQHETKQNGDNQQPTHQLPHSTDKAPTLPTPTNGTNVPMQ